MRFNSTELKHLAKGYSVEKANEWARLPFFYISENEVDLLYKEGDLDEGRVVKPEYSVDVDRICDPDYVMRLLPFTEFTALTPTYIEGVQNYSKIKYLVEEQMWLVEHLFTPFEGDETKTIASLLVDMSTETKEGTGVTLAHDVSRKFRNTEDIMRLKYLFPVEEMYPMAYQTIGIFLSLFTYVENTGQYLVKETTPGKKAKKGGKLAKKKTPWDYQDQIRYIYIDEPPSTRTEKSVATGTGSPKRGHHRRATWVHLTHERYKNHPNYGGVIRRRATWVGPKEWTVNNTVYTLHEPEVENGLK